MAIEIPFEIRANIYQNIVEEIIADGRLNSDEEILLEKLQRELELPEETAQRIYSAKAKGYLEGCLEAAISDERFSPKEEEEINAISESLGVEITYDEETKSFLNRYRLYWMIENGYLKEIEVGVNLQRNEKCYFDCDADLYEYKRVARRVRSGRPMLRTKIAQDFYWRIKDLGVQTISDDILNHVDSGRLFLTNERLIFTSTQKNTTIELTKILDFIPYECWKRII